MPRIAWVKNALVQPCSGLPRQDDVFQVDGGVFDETGAPVPLSYHRFDRVNRLPPNSLRREDIPVTRGQWLFGGWLQDHFGHFVFAGIGRLWALQGRNRDFAGVVFLRLPDEAVAVPERSPLLKASIRDVLLCLGVPVARKAAEVSRPQRFERLAVPEQVLVGPTTPPDDNAAFMATLRGMRRSPRVRDGLIVPKLYVSRRRLAHHQGGLMFERLLEENLAAEGYVIMHPERLSIPEQIATYAAARQLIFAEGSALHVAVGCIEPDAPVVVIARRMGREAELRGYAEAAGLRRFGFVDAITGAVVTMEADGVTPRPPVSAIAVLDLERLRRDLVAAGFCRGDGWRMPTPAETAARIAGLMEARQKAMPDRRFAHVPREAYAASRWPAEPIARG